jgi:hypothetical protein
MRVAAGLELLMVGRVLRVRLVRRWLLGSLWLFGTLWLAIGPLRILVHTRRVYWEEP